MSNYYSDCEIENDELVFDPYNPNNCEITLNDVQCILSRYGLPMKVHNINLYKRAFIHKSYVKKPDYENKKNNIRIMPRPNDCIPLKTKSNERLEFLGDGVLECITKYYLYRRFPKENEGFMTEKKIALVKNEHIGKLAYQIGLHKWFIISKHAEEKKIRTNVKKLGCLFEAFLGALFLDFNKVEVVDDKDWFKSVCITGPGFQIAQKFIETIFEKHVDWIELIQNDDNYKNILQVVVQKAFKVTPTYIIVNEDEEEGYTMAVCIILNVNVNDYSLENAEPIETYMNNTSKIHLPSLKESLDKESIHTLFICLATSKHKIKKKAEQQACFNALEKIQV